MKAPRRRFLHLAGATAILPALSNAVCAQAHLNHSVHVTFSLPIGSLARVRDSLNDGTLEVIVTERPGGRALAVGKLAVIDNRVDQASGTVRFKAVFDNTYQVLSLGQLVDVHVLEYTAIGEVLP